MNTTAVSRTPASKGTLNGDLVALAREYRGYTQQELASAVDIRQGTVAKIEGGLIGDVDEAVLSRIAKTLRFPVAFFLQDEMRLSFGSSALYYRKRENIRAGEKKRISGQVNLARIGLKHLLEMVELAPAASLPRIPIDPTDPDPLTIAQQVRAAWNVPDGPIANLTALVERAGVVVFPCDFACRAMDGTSFRLVELPPVVFINRNLPPDRWRFTLAHELAHLVMHDVPREEMEDEADAFAAELLMPRSILGPQLKASLPIRLDTAFYLKTYWRASAASIITQADQLGLLSAAQKKSIWSKYSMAGYRSGEPGQPPREVPTTLAKILDYCLTVQKLTPADLADLSCMEEADFREIFGVPGVPRLQLRLVN